MDLPRGHLQNFPGDSLTNISFTASSSGPRTSSGLGDVQSTFWTRWYARLTASAKKEGTACVLSCVPLLVRSYTKAPQQEKQQLALSEVRFPEGSHKSVLCQAWARCPIHPLFDPLRKKHSKRNTHRETQMATRKWMARDGLHLTRPGKIYSENDWFSSLEGF